MEQFVCLLWRESGLHNWSWLFSFYQVRGFWEESTPPTSPSLDRITISTSLWVSTDGLFREVSLMDLQRIGRHYCCSIFFFLSFVVWFPFGEYNLFSFLYSFVSFLSLMNFLFLKKDRKYASWQIIIFIV